MDAGTRHQNLQFLRSLRQRLDADGYAALPGFARNAGTGEVAAGLGGTIAPWGGPVVHELVPHPNAAPNTYSGIFGLGGFPFHTDLAHWSVPPRYVVLRCVRGYVDVPTRLVDGAVLTETVGMSAMRRALVTPRRPQSGRMHLMRLLQRCGSTELIRWDEVFLKAASRVGREAFDLVRAGIRSTASRSVAVVDDGDVLVIDNWRMLHARPAIAPDRADRRLERVYLESIG